MAVSSNKTIAKNAIMLTLRMVLVTIVGLYTSRLILEALGLDEYGVYGVIGGVVGMVTFLNSSMAGATSRFIIVSIGEGNSEKTRRVFSVSFYIHLTIALLVAVLAETGGLWFVNNKMNFPEGMSFTVNVLYQFTIISMIFSFTQTPYSADIMANEKMSIYAYFEIFNVLVKLGIIFLLFAIDENRLIWYSGLLLLQSIIFMFFYRLYCIRNFPEAKLTKFSRQDKNLAKEMLAFSGYDLYGNMCVVAKTQGIPIIQNIFFGVIVNGATSFATSITGALSGLSSAILTAFRPSIMKFYASKQLDSMIVMMRRATLFSMLVFGILLIPIYVDTDSVVKLWLGQIPPHTVPFFRIISLASYVTPIVLVNNAAIHATGNIKAISFVSGTVYLLCPILSYVILKKVYMYADLVYWVNLIMTAIIAILGCIFVKSQIHPPRLWEYVSGLLKSVIVFILVLLVGYYAQAKFVKFLPLEGSVWIQLARLTLLTLSSCLIMVLFNGLFVLNRDERQLLLSKTIGVIRTKLCR